MQRAAPESAQGRQCLQRWSAIITSAPVTLYTGLGAMLAYVVEAGLHSTGADRTKERPFQFYHSTMDFSARSTMGVRRIVMRHCRGKARCFA